MEDYEAQEVEFWRKLEEEGMSRSSMLRRSAAAAFGLTILGQRGHRARRDAVRGRAPPLKGRGRARGARQGREEGRQAQHDRAAARLGELRRDDVDLPEEVRHPDHERQPERQLGAGEPGDSLARRATRALRTPSTSVSSFAIAGANEGLYAKYFPSTFSTIPRAMKDTRGFWLGDYWGAISIGYNQNLVSNPPKTWKDLLKPEYKGKVAHERQPAHVELRGVRRHRSVARERRLAEGRRPRHRLLRAAEEVGQLHPGRDDTADGRLRPDADLDRLGLQQPRVHQGVPGGAVEGHRSRATASTAATTRRRSTRPLRIRGRRGSGRSSSTPTRVRSST